MEGGDTTPCEALIVHTWGQADGSTNTIMEIPVRLAYFTSWMQWRTDDYLNLWRIDNTTNSNIGPVTMIHEAHNPTFQVVADEGKLCRLIQHLSCSNLILHQIPRCSKHCQSNLMLVVIGLIMWRVAAPTTSRRYAPGLAKEQSLCYGSTPQLGLENRP